jgi:hypothetical protein
MDRKFVAPSLRLSDIGRCGMTKVVRLPSVLMQKRSHCDRLSQAVVAAVGGIDEKLRFVDQVAA